MPGQMRHGGYTGVVEVDTEAGILFGRVIGLRDVITFQGRTAEEARQSFKDSVDAYLEDCAADGDEPEKPYSGTIFIRTRPDVHRALAHEAELRGESLNRLAEQALLRAIPPQVAGKPSREGKRPGKGQAGKAASKGQADKAASKAGGKGRVGVKR